MEELQLKYEDKSRKWTERDIEAELVLLDKKIEEAKESEGDVDVRDYTILKGEFLKNCAKDYPEAEKILREAYAITGGASKKMEILFQVLLMNIEKLDLDAIKPDIATCKQLVEDGADWEKKNKLKIFEGVYCMLIRDFKRGAELFLSSVATFTCTELLTYERFVFYAVVLAMVSMERKVIRKEVIHNPDILAAIGETPHLREFADSLYKCNYKDFFKAFVEIIDLVRADKFLDTHHGHFTKEMRLVAYK